MNGACIVRSNREVVIMNERLKQYWFEVYVKGDWIRQPETFDTFLACQAAAIANNHHPYRIKNCMVLKAEESKP